MTRGIALFTAALAAMVFTSSALARAGYVHDMTGTVTVRNGSQAPRPLKVGDLIAQGQTVSTAERSTAVIKFEDGQVMALHERTSFTIQQYNYNKQRVRESSAAFRLLQGGLRFITGVIGSTNRNALRISTATTTVGIRGTDGTLIVDPVTQIVTAAIAAGAVTMTTAQVTVEVGAGNFSSAGPNARPTAPAPTAQATGAVAQTLNSLASAQNIPINTPVVVEASARAAAAQAQAAELRAKAAAAPQDAALRQQAQEASAAAAAATGTAVAAAQQAYQAALQAGATPPAPPAPPPAAPQQPQGTGTAPTTTTSTPGSSGAGGGGGSTPISGTASPN